jgi:hypothetical protein
VISCGPVLDNGERKILSRKSPMDVVKIEGFLLSVQYTLSIYMSTSVVMFIAKIWSSQDAFRPFKNSSPVRRRSFAVVPITPPSEILIRFFVMSFRMIGMTWIPNHCSSNCLTRSYRSSPCFLSTILYEARYICSKLRVEAFLLWIDVKADCRTSHWRSKSLTAPWLGMMFCCRGRLVIFLQQSEEVVCIRRERNKKTDRCRVFNLAHANCKRN